MTYLSNIKMLKMGCLVRYLINFLFILSLLTGGYGIVHSQTPVAANGKLQVTEGQLVSSLGNPIQLRGMSTHGLQWYSTCINFDAISAMTSSWGADVLRLAMYVEEDGYVTDPEYYKSFIDQLVDLTEQFGIYCIIDWHVHDPGDPWANIDDARDFWAYMSAKHAGKDHVLYEICNEPNGVDWSRVKSYADEIIPIIRSNDPNTIIIVGTPNWSQDVDIASMNPLNYENIMYTLHFYSGTHGQSLRDKANTAMSNGIAIFVTEWGTSQASGDGGPYLTPESDDWISWMKQNNISWCNWSYSDKNEVSAALVPGSCFGGEWNNTSISGEYVKYNMLNPADSWVGDDNIPPVGAITMPDPNAKFEINETITISATAFDQDGTVSLVEFYANGSKIGEDATSPYSIQWVANILGEIKLSLVIRDNENADNNSSEVPIEILEEIVQYAYPDGIPHSIEGIIRSTYFDVGGEGIAYHDVDATNKGGASRIDEGVDTETSDGGNVGYVVNGEWLEYTVNVATSGSYDMNIRVASLPGGGQFHLEFDGIDKTGIVNVPSTGSWESYQNLSVSDIALETGEQVMRMAIDIGDFNFSSMTFSYAGTVINPTSVSLSSSNLELNTGTSQTLEAMVLPVDATNKSVTWTSSNAAVASVSSNGLVTALSAGNATIRATTVVGGLTDECQVTVIPGGDTYSLVINTIGSGTVSLDPAGGVYEAGTLVNLNALPNTGYVFNNWSGDISGTAASVSVIIDDNKTITATFTAEAAGCEISTAINLPFTLTGSGEYCWVTSGEIDYINSWNLDLLEVNGVDLTNTYAGQMPSKIEGNYYIHMISSVSWGHIEIIGTDSNNNTDLYTLTALTEGEGSVLVNPVAGSYEEGTLVILTATPDDGYYFDSWTGDVRAVTETITLTMDNNKTVTANFLPISVDNYILTVNIIGSGTVTPSGGTYIDGSVATLSANPDPGFVFTGWSGDVTGTSSSVSITMNSDKTVTATFEESSVLPICDNPEIITIPYTQNGTGEYCFTTSDNIAWVNSWSMDKVEINGVDVTNVWADVLPEKINGNYYIYSKGLNSWSHLEISGTKSINSIADLPGSPVSVFPNPFFEYFTLNLQNTELIHRVILVDQLGKIVRVFDKADLTEEMILGENLSKGIYYLKVICNSNEQTLILTKQ